MENEKVFVNLHFSLPYKVLLWDLFRAGFNDLVTPVNEPCIFWVILLFKGMFSKFQDGHISDPPPGKDANVLLDFSTVTSSHEINSFGHLGS